MVIPTPYNTSLNESLLKKRIPPISRICRVYNTWGLYVDVKTEKLLQIHTEDQRYIPNQFD